ncbi:MAG: hypothetical protein GX796_10885 [Clostridiaceae bacterium]|jgi:uncharacterized cupin superfamily protein|nr:hypothetical protein [Clostridiaceae bacterium]
MKAYIFNDETFVRNYGENGVACVELLPGTLEGFKAYKYSLKAGGEVSPQRYSDKAVVFIFRTGKGYIAGTDGGFGIDRLCFYAPDFDKSEYVIHAVEDMDFVMCVADMNEYDFKRAGECRVHTPFFRTVDQCYNYDQSCKTPGTWSKSVLFGDCGRLGKITIGIVRGTDSGGTIEKGHPEVHQWDFVVGDSELELNVDGEKHLQKAGDWHFIPAGYDHSLCALNGKEAYYVWVELYTSEHGVKKEIQ